ncbi:uncharacterized protein LOC111058660 [Nilaparvata lugens]|uniref:uncharacterized protein LOC111058660 n=1 Tax=Nilaparvata lugens TaxID=108931 RepID=UPI00193D0BAE|nr:uncharacterized protein LOC111058660 [Nilaparvata lugens]
MGMKIQKPHSTTFDAHFKNPYDGAVAFYKDGVLKAWVAPTEAEKFTTAQEVRDGFNKAK